VKDAEPSAGLHAQSSDHLPVVLSLILVSYNSGHVLTGFINALQNHPPACRWELIVVDNASDDDSVSCLRSTFANATIIENDRNRGFASAVNQGVQQAKGEYYLLANPDISWDAGTLDELMAFFCDRPKAAAVTPGLRDPGGDSQPSVRRFPTHGNIWFSRGVPGLGWLARLFGWHPYTVPDPPSASVVEAAAAACLLVRASAFGAVGGMDDGYFLYVEDTDLCRRLADAGWETWINPGIQVIHQWGRRGPHYLRLKAYHRDGIRRYFRKFHSSKRIRNGILFIALWLADALARLTSGGGETSRA